MQAGIICESEPSKDMRGWFCRSSDGETAAKDDSTGKMYSMCLLIHIYISMTPPPQENNCDTVGEE